MNTIEEVIAAQRAEREEQARRARRRFILFALESVGLDGLPRVSGYTVDQLHAKGLIEPVGDNEQRWRLTAEGRIVLASSATDSVAAHGELTLFGEAS